VRGLIGEALSNGVDLFRDDFQGQVGRRERRLVPKDQITPVMQVLKESGMANKRGTGRRSSDFGSLRGSTRIFPRSRVGCPISGEVKGTPTRE
jgi:hypothetical protein